MNFLDIIIAIPLCYFIYKGWKRGLIFELAALAGIIVGCWVCVHFSTWVGEALNLKGSGGVLAAFFITFMAVVVGAYFLGKALEGVVKMVKGGAVNKILGALLGMCKCLCVLSVLLNFVLLADPHEVIITQNAKEESFLFEPSYKIGNKLTSALTKYVHHQRENYKAKHSNK